MDLKKPLTFDEQLDKLIAHGMIVADRKKAKDIFKTQKNCNSFYIFSAFSSLQVLLHCLQVVFYY